MGLLTGREILLNTETAERTAKKARSFFWIGFGLASRKDAETQSCKRFWLLELEGKDRKV